MKALIVEDEQQLAEALAEIIKPHGFISDTVYSGDRGLEYALTNLYDVIILDIMLPVIDGLTVLKSLRARQISTPVLLLTAKSSNMDIINGLDTGADDYLCKPFSTGELTARIKALARRQCEYIGRTLAYFDIRLDCDALELISHDKSVKLGSKEYNILEMLIVNRGNIVSKDRIAEKIWGYESETEYNSVEVYMSFLRKKLKSVNSCTRIKTVRGVGYTLSKE